MKSYSDYYGFNTVPYISNSTNIWNSDNSENIKDTVFQNSAVYNYGNFNDININQSNNSEFSTNSIFNTDFNPNMSLAYPITPVSPTYSIDDISKILNIIIQSITDYLEKFKSQTSKPQNPKIISEDKFERIMNPEYKNIAGYNQFYANQKEKMDGWLVTEGNSEYVYGYDYGRGYDDIMKSDNPFDNNQYNGHIGLNGKSNGAIAKTIPTIPGKEYTVTFDYALHPYDKSAKDFTISNGTDVMDLKAQNNTQWTQGTYTFTATGNETTISFKNKEGTDDNSLGLILDNIVIVENCSDLKG